MHAAATGRVSKGGPEGPEGPEGSLPNMLGRRPDGAALGGHGPARPAHACTCIRRLLPHRDHGDDPCEVHCPAKVTSARALAFPVPNRFQPAFSLNHPVNKYCDSYLLPVFLCPCGSWTAGVRAQSRPLVQRWAFQMTRSEGCGRADRCHAGRGPVGGVCGPERPCLDDGGGAAASRRGGSTAAVPDDQVLELEAGQAVGIVVDSRAAPS